MFQLRIFFEDLPNIPTKARWKPNATTILGKKGSGSIFDTLSEPRGIWAQKNNTILLVDCGSNKIAEYDRDGRTRKIDTYPVGSYGHDRVWEPTDIVFDEASQTFIVCDFANRRVVRLSQQSKPENEIIINNVACHGIAIDFKGNMYVSDVEKHEVKRYKPGDRHGQVVAGGNGQGAGLDQLNYPTYICIGSNQEVYVSDSDNHRIMRWDNGATEGHVVAGHRGKGQHLSQLSFPTGVVVDRNGTIYVADCSNSRIMRWLPGATRGEVIAGRLTSGESPDQLNGPQGLRFDRDGNLCVADCNNNRVQRFKLEKSE